MLLLSRKNGETILLAGGLIVLTVSAIKGNRVVIGVDAPKDIDVVRGELLNGSEAAPCAER